LAHGFRGLCPWPIVLGPVVRQHIMVRVYGGFAKLLTSCQSGSKERQEGARLQYPLQGHAPSDLTQALPTKPLTYGSLGEIQDLSYS
jgi:hypothetical protein